MAGPGGGPSRRSHTKSRKGCKTCKRRHIRCDETYPSCRNCIKHNCPCDYMENASRVSSTESFQTSFSIPELIWNPEVEATLDYWQKVGSCTMGETRVDLDPEQNYTKNDLLLIYHCLRAGQGSETNRYTIWTGQTPRFLSIAARNPFLMHAVFSFTSATLAFESQAADAKSLAYHHGGIALKGLQNAITDFSKANADAVLGASILLSWQANDWRSWVSLITGIRTVLTSMRAWKDESMIPDLITEQELSIPDSFPAMTRNPVSEEMRASYESTLQQIYLSFDNLSRHFDGRDESKWVDQLKDYFSRLQHARPAHTPEEQFNHLYAFRKWMFWVPSSTLNSDRCDYWTLVLLAHLYASALALEPLYPQVAPTFCSLIAVRPLEEIIKAFDNLSPSLYQDHRVQDMIQMMEYPKRVINEYHSRSLQFDISNMNPRRSPPGLDRLNLDLTKYIETYSDTGHYSPAFIPSPLMQHDSSSLHSGHSSPYLDIPSDRLSGSFSFPGDRLSESYSSLPGNRFSGASYGNIPGDRLSGASWSNIPGDRLSGASYTTSSYGSPYISSPGYTEDTFFRPPETPVSGFVAQQYLWT